MKRLIVGLVALVILSGCIHWDWDELLSGPLAKKTRVTLHIKKGGQGTIRYDRLDIVSSKTGGELEQQVAESTDSLAEDLRLAYGCTDIERGTERDSEGRLNAYVEGKAEDIFCFLRCFHVYDTLTRDTHFSYQWDGEIFSLEERISLDARDEGQEEESSQTEYAFDNEILVITEGEFVSSTVGQISTGMKELLISEKELMDAQVVGFKIRGLAEQW